MAKYRFSSLKFCKIQIFIGMRNGFLYIFLSHTEFSPKTQIFLVIYTNFVLDQSGRSDLNSKKISQDREVNEYIQFFFSSGLLELFVYSLS